MVTSVVRTFKRPIDMVLETKSMRSANIPPLPLARSRPGPIMERLPQILYS